MELQETECFDTPTSMVWTNQKSGRGPSASLTDGQLTASWQDPASNLAEMPPRPACIEDLPVEILAKIFGKLDSFQQWQARAVCKDWKSILSEEIELKKNVVLDLGTLPHANLVSLAERDGFYAFLTWIFGLSTKTITVVCPPEWNEMTDKNTETNAETNVETSAETNADMNANTETNANVETSVDTNTDTNTNALVDVLNCSLLLLKTFGQATRHSSIPNLIVCNYRMRNALLIEILAGNRGVGAEVTMTLKNCVFSFDCCDPSDDRQMRQFNVLVPETTIRFGRCFVPDMLIIADTILPDFKDLDIMTDTLRQIIQEDSLEARTYRLGLFEFLKSQEPNLNIRNATDMDHLHARALRKSTLYMMVYYGLGKSKGCFSLLPSVLESLKVI